MKRHKLLVAVMALSLCLGLVGFASGEDQPPPKPTKPVEGLQAIGATVQGTLYWPDPAEGKPVPGYEAGCSKIQVIVRVITSSAPSPGGELYLGWSTLKQVWATPKGNQCAYILEGLPGGRTFQLEATYEGEWSIAGKYPSVAELIRLKAGQNVTKDLKLGVGAIPK